MYKIDLGLGLRFKGELVSHGSAPQWGLRTRLGMRLQRGSVSTGGWTWFLTEAAPQVRPTGSHGVFGP